MEPSKKVNIQLFETILPYVLHGEECIILPSRIVEANLLSIYGRLKDLGA